MIYNFQNYWPLFLAIKLCVICLKIGKLNKIFADLETIWVIF